ncbi:MAG: CDP-glucose 4,6-dehydratase [Magnetococcales bacterium]|nr:CDP-glucose 4,6-dehydratase [Magnetococcales bacterium]
MNPEFWRNKRVFITGHTGFKGGWLALWLMEYGAHVVGYALAPPTTPSFFKAANLQEGLLSHEADVGDGEALRSALMEQAPDIVFHLAAQPLVRRSYRDPVETYRTNVMGTVNLLEAVRQVESVRVVISVTSDKCYENREWLWGYRESDPMGGHDPYSSSKGCAELITSAYRHSFFQLAGQNRSTVALASVRAGNVIGGGDWAEDRLIPDIIHGFEEGRPVEIRNPNAIRPWQHVLEPLSGYLLLAEKLWEDGITYAGGWNFGPREEDAIPVGKIVESMVKLWGTGAEWQVQSGDHPHEAHYLKLDCSKARSLIGWQTRWDIQQGLLATISWHRAFTDGADMRAFSVAQINHYRAS